MNKKYVKAVKDKDFYKFQKLILKDGEYIFNFICNKIGEDNKDCEKVFDLVMIDIWNDLEKDNIIKESLEEIILKIIRNAKEVEDKNYYGLDMIVDNLYNEKILKKRRLFFRSHRIIEKMIVEKFKNELGIRDTIYERMISTKSWKKRYREFDSLKLEKELCYFYVFVITEEKIYFKELNMKYEEIKKETVYNSYRFNDIDFVKIIENKIEDLPGVFKIKFKDNKEIEFKYFFSEDMIEFKKFLKNLFIKKGIYKLAS